MTTLCNNCNQTYETPEGVEAQCPWCPPQKGNQTPNIPPQIGKYEILEKIGAGGMGVVYRAKHTELKNNVALKVMVAGEHASEETLLRFQREARSAAALHHPNIAPVFDVGQEKSLYYIVMELVEGKNLDQRVRDKITPKEAARITRDIARALAYAHERNIVHRDVKPGNILVDKNGNAKLVDFGLAKSLRDDKTLTRTGEIIGTASYMPPEQISGSMREVDEQSDIYSLGTVLYELLSGEAAYGAETLIMTIRQIEDASPIPPTRQNSNVTREMETICLKAMAKEKKRRYTTAADFADDLDRFLKGEPIAARPSTFFYRTTKWVQRKPAVSTAAAMTLLLIIITVPLLFWNTPPAPPGPGNQALLLRATPHLKTARHEIEKASKYTAKARLERRTVLTKAVTELNTAIKIYPEFADAFFYRGIARKALAKSELARKDFDEAIRLDPRHAEAYYARIELRLKSLRTKKLPNLVETPPEKKIFAQKMEQIEADIRLLKKLTTRPELALAAEAAFAALSAETKDWTFAHKSASQALEHNWAFADAYVIRAAIWKKKAVFSKEDYKQLLEKALEDSNAAIRYEVNNIEAYRIRAEIHLALDQYEDAILDLEEMKSIAPDEAQTYIDRATVLRLDPIEIRSRRLIRIDLDRAIDLDPTNVHARFFRASLTMTSYKIKTRFRQARKDLDIALRYAPDFSEALTLRMICHLALQDEPAFTRDEKKMEQLFAAFDIHGTVKSLRDSIEFVATQFYIPTIKLMTHDAENLLQLKRYEEAKEIYQGVLEKLSDPKVPVSLPERKQYLLVTNYNLACIESLSENPKKSIEMLRKSFEAGFRDWNHLLSDPDLRSARKDREFYILLTRAITRDTEELLKLRQFKKAEKIYRRILQRINTPKMRFRPADRKRILMMIHHDLARIASHSGNPEEGLESLHKAIKAGYRDWDHLLSDPYLEAVRNEPGFTALLDQYRN